MTFRDDHDAALARAAALEDEVERTKAERDELAERVAALEAENQARRDAPRRAEPSRAEPRTERAASSSERRTNRIAVAFGVLAAAALMAFGWWQSCRHRDEVSAWQAKQDARRGHQQRWGAIVSVEPCVRRAAWDSASARRNTPDHVDPRGTYLSTPIRTPGCLDGAKSLLADAATAPAIKTALGRWVDLAHDLEGPAKALNAYYSNRDWKEDNFAGAPALWAPVSRLLDRQQRILEEVRGVVLPALRDEVRAIAKRHEDQHGRDDLYWRTALQVQLWEINDRSYAAAGIYAGRPPDHAAAVQAVRPAVVQLLELAKQAPIEVRREIRKLDWITSQIAAGGELRGETPLWHLANADDDLIPRSGDAIPAMPPDPGPRPADRD